MSENRLTFSADPTGAPARDLDVLHARFAPGLVRHFARRLGGTAGFRIDAAEDLAQQTWIAFSAAMASGKYDAQRGAASTYLYAIARHVWLRHLRSTGRRVPADFAWERTRGEDEESDPNAADIEAIEEVRAVMNGASGGTEFSDRDRAVMRGVAAGQSDRELGRGLGMAPSTAHEQKRSVVDRLRKWLIRRGFGDDSVTEIVAASERSGVDG